MTCRCRSCLLLLTDIEVRRFKLHAELDSQVMQALRDTVLDQSTWEFITNALSFLSPILDCIETIEADRQVNLSPLLC